MKVINKGQLNAPLWFPSFSTAPSEKTSVGLDANVEQPWEVYRPVQHCARAASRDQDLDVSCSAQGQTQREKEYSARRANAHTVIITLIIWSMLKLNQWEIWFWSAELVSWKYSQSRGMKNAQRLFWFCDVFLFPPRSCLTCFQFPLHFKRVFRAFGIWSPTPDWTPVH